MMRRLIVHFTSVVDHPIHWGRCEYPVNAYSAFSPALPLLSSPDKLARGEKIFRPIVLMLYFHLTF